MTLQNFRLVTVFSWDLIFSYANIEELKGFNLRNSVISRVSDSESRIAEFDQRVDKSD